MVGLDGSALTPPAHMSSEMFRNSSNTTVSNSNLVVVSGNYIVANAPGPSRAAAAAPSRVEKHEIAQWLSRLDFRSVQDETYRKHTPGTGQWLIRSEGLQSWVWSDGGAYWIMGMAGAGKTYASSTVIHYLENEVETDTPPVVVFTYFRYNEGHTVRDIFASIASQLLRSSAGDLLYGDFVTLYIRHDKDSPATTYELGHLLRSSFARLAKVFLALDALDELPEEVRNELLAELATFNCHIFITSRPHLESSTGLLLNVVHVRWESLAAANNDIRMFIESKLDTEPRLRDICSQRPDLREEVRETLLNLSGGMFLLSAFQIKSLQRVTTMKELREDLNSMPREVNAMYQVMWTRVQEQGHQEADLARRAIIWAHYGWPRRDLRAPLTAEVICDALGVSETLQSYDADAVPTTSVVLSVCQGLMIFETRGAVYFKLAHYTTASFIEGILQEPPALFLSSCMLRLQSEGFPTRFVPDTEGKVLAAHSTLHLFGRFAFHFWASCIRYLTSAQIPPQIREILATWTTVPAFLGADLHYMQLNHLFIATGHFDLLPCDLDESQYTSKTSRGWSFLHLASYAGRVGFVQKLLDMSLFDINSLTEDVIPATPLSIAAQQNHTELCAHLLAIKEMHVNAQNGCHSPLGWALHHGNAKITRLLLAHSDIQLELPGGEIPLVKAALYPELVSILLSRKVDVNAICPLSGGTALQEIMFCPSDDTPGRRSLELILSHPDVNVNLALPAWNMSSALAICIRIGNGNRKLDMLLSHKSLNISARDRSQRTPLHWVLSNESPGASEILRQLLGHPGINVNARDCTGRSAVFCGIFSRRENLEHAPFRTLLEDPRTDKNLADFRVRTPLMVASQQASMDAVQTLLHAGASVSMRCIRGRTALFYAVASLRVSELRSDEDTECDLDRDSSRFRFQFERGYAQRPMCSWGAVKILLDQDETDVQWVDDAGWTAPMYAMFQLGDALRRDRFRFEDEVNRRTRILAAANDLPDLQSLQEREEEDARLISESIEWVETGRQLRLYSYLTVASLLSRPEIDINHSNDRGQTSLHMACALGHLEVVKTILSQPGVDVRKRGKTGKTALVIAAGRGHVDIVRLLLRRFWNDVDEITQAYRHAARYEKVEVMAHLEERLVRLGDRRGASYARLEEEEREREFADALKSLAQLVAPSEPSLPLNGGQRSTPVSWVRRYTLEFPGR